MASRLDRVNKGVAAIAGLASGFDDGIASPHAARLRSLIGDATPIIDAVANANLSQLRGEPPTVGAEVMECWLVRVAVALRDILPYLRTMSTTSSMRTVSAASSLMSFTGPKSDGMSPNEPFLVPLMLAPQIVVGSESVNPPCHRRPTFSPAPGGKHPKSEALDVSLESTGHGTAPALSHTREPVAPGPSTEPHGKGVVFRVTTPTHWSSGADSGDRSGDRSGNPLSPSPRGGSSKALSALKVSRSTEDLFTADHRHHASEKVKNSDRANVTFLEDSTMPDRVNQYELMYELGRGAQGAVVLAVDTDTDEPRAMKIIPRPRAFADAARQSGIASEIEVMKKCRHPNILRLIEVIDDISVNTIYVVTQFARGGSLPCPLRGEGANRPFFRCGADPDALAATLSQAKERWVCGKDGRLPTSMLPVAQIASIASQILSGLHYLHRHNIVHRDIKPDNILFGDGALVLLADFGVSELVRDDECATAFCGSPAFWPPELAQLRLKEAAGTSAPTGGATVNEMPTFESPVKVPAPPSEQRTAPSSPRTPTALSALDKAKAADVWAAGATLFCLLYGRLPVGTPHNPNFLTDVAAATAGGVEVPVTTMHFGFAQAADTVAPGALVPDSLRELLAGMLTVEPEKRLKAATCLRLAGECVDALDSW